ncbi:tripartite tricarboxylate transporter TctB family protein [Streptomyces xinghaiensis]|uniref:tripartite tricarboxylate transporter TctB family protein n=1 Tax=Streptomyces xinghaiensis TaxID=1038928 RepID=UPI002E115FFC|nr:tripartite tricarboxylate transporter TctB family protein [Streptomyces xinghaiensis]
MHHFRFSHRTVACAIGLPAAAYTVLAFRIPEFAAVQVPVQPGTLPRALGLLLLVLSVALFFQSGSGPAGDGPPDAGAEEAGAGGAGAGGSTGEDAMAGEAGEAGGAGPRRPAPPAATLGRLADDRLELLALLGSICLYVVLFVPLGFVLSTALYVTGTAWYLGYRRHWANALTGTGLAAGLYLGMSEGLGVALPTGPLPF